jgi:hypothetical protein
MDDESKLNRLANELDDADDEVTAEHYFNVEPGGTLIVDQSGKHKALGPDELTPTDPPRKVQSEPPKSGIPGYISAGAGGVAKVLAAVNNAYTLLALALLVAAFIAWLRLRP